MNELKDMWKSLSLVDRKAWRRLEAFDKTRYTFERRLYFKVIGEKDTLCDKRVRKKSNRKRKRSRACDAKAQTKQQKVEPIVRLFVQYWYMGDDYSLQMQVEEHRERKCPICHLNFVSHEVYFSSSFLVELIIDVLNVDLILYTLVIRFKAYYAL